jgi:regulator of cell morphogenesis and NO signaling
MTTLTPEISVGQLVADDPRRARLFERLGIDYCCGGRVPLDRACRQKGLDVEAVLSQLALDEFEAPHDGHDGFDASRVRMAELIDHILSTRHAYLDRELPRLSALAGQVVGAHGLRHPELRAVRDVFNELKDELIFHMLNEEKVLFPTIARLDAAAGIPLPGGSVTGAIRLMEHEHSDAGLALARLRTLTDGYTPPADACPTYRALLDGLAELETDLHVHIHEENNILFPRARAAEELLMSTAAETDWR